MVFFNAGRDRGLVAGVCRGAQRHRVGVRGEAWSHYGDGAIFEDDWGESNDFSWCGSEGYVRGVGAAIVH